MGQPLTGAPGVVEPRGVDLGQAVLLRVLDDVVLGYAVAARDVADPLEVVLHDLLVDLIAVDDRNAVQVAETGGMRGPEPVALLGAQRIPPLLHFGRVGAGRGQLNVLTADLDRSPRRRRGGGLLDGRRGRRVDAVECLEQVFEEARELLREPVEEPPDEPLMRRHGPVVGHRKPHGRQRVRHRHDGTAQRVQLFAAVAQRGLHLHQPGAELLLLGDQLPALGDRCRGRVALPRVLQALQLRALAVDDGLQRIDFAAHPAGGVDQSLWLRRPHG
ncbi:hypothetical protein MMAG44476_31967 [Mycolicibacterium mageritense DSM 44476 = CIP 104973]|uniref:DUF222 domain-containing protein n=2 Tax=Mycolicibacterium mageritense TaxID=53462 RepID=A0ABM7HVV7_MYCME|nr:hypothetical protein MMAGJ_40230 [Mycolicibacterium mageritense]